MNKRTLRLGGMVAAITLIPVLGACTGWQRQALTGPRDVVVMTNERAPNPTKDASYFKDPTEAKDHDVLNEVLAGGLDLQPGDKAQGFRNYPLASPFGSRVAEMWARLALLSLPLSAVSPARDVSLFQVEPDALCHKSPAKFIVTAGVLSGLFTYAFFASGFLVATSTGEHLKVTGLGVAGGAVNL